VPVSDGGVGWGAGQVCLPAAGRPGDHDGAVVAGPVGLGEAEDGA
jgi:hypothetical protein